MSQPSSQQGELFCRCDETEPPAFCPRCERIRQAEQAAHARRLAWLERVGNYARGSALESSCVVRRGAARFRVIRRRYGGLEAFAIGPEGRETFVGPVGLVFAAGAEEFPVGKTG